MKKQSTCCFNTKPPISLKNRNRKNLSLDIQCGSQLPPKITSAVSNLFGIGIGKKSESNNEDRFRCVTPNRSTFDISTSSAESSGKKSNSNYSKIYSLESAYRLSSNSPSTSDNTVSSTTTVLSDGTSNTSNNSATTGTLLASSNIGLTKKRMLSLSIKTQGLDSDDFDRSTAQGPSNNVHGNSLRLRSKTMTTLETSTPLIQTRFHIGANNNKPNDNSQSPVVESFDNGDIRPELYKQSTYPHGPLLVVQPNIYLYSEPKLDEILGFDVVVNVGTEVPNLKEKVPAKLRQNIDYYHIRWTHNTKITKDLEFLTSLIHTASLQNKRVLVHCQCGVSRSASLIIAYIMRYENLTLNDAYNKLKSVARDISPNMGLIFQLVEWSEKLEAITGRKPQARPVGIGIGIDIGVNDHDSAFKRDDENSHIVGDNSLARVKTPTLCSCSSSTNSTSSSVSSCFTLKTPTGLEIPATFSTNTTVTTTSSASSASEENTGSGSSTIITAPKSELLKNIYSYVG